MDRSRNRVLEGDKDRDWYVGKGKEIGSCRDRDGDMDVLGDNRRNVYENRDKAKERNIGMDGNRDRNRDMDKDEGNDRERNRDMDMDSDLDLARRRTMI